MSVSVVGSPGGSALLGASYAYDAGGNLVSETAGGACTTYLNDALNPTGYTHPVESKVGTTVTQTSVLGDRMLGQVTATGQSEYLVTDGHGSTRALTSATGGVTEPYAYDAFGQSLGFYASAAGTTYLFGGDASYDGGSGLYLHGNGVRLRDGFVFTQRDSYGGDVSDPRSLHKRVYVGSDPVNATDPTGMFSFRDASDLADAAGGVAGDLGGVEHLGSIAGMVVTAFGFAADVYGGVIDGVINANMNPHSDYGAAFSLSFLSSFTRNVLGSFGVPCYIGAGIQTGMLAFGNDLINGRGSYDNLMNALYAGFMDGAMRALNGEECFVAGTLVLRGDDETKIRIEDLRVGDRVKTDGGAANSPDGRSASARPDETSVDADRWFEIRLTTTDGNWEVTALEPGEWVISHGVTVGGSVRLAEVVDLAEMGASEDLVATVTGLGGCPEIESGPGRVVLSTVLHSSDDVYELELSEVNGRNEVVGVTGVHRFYDETRGWVATRDLHAGDRIRGRWGPVTVMGLTHLDGVHRVYNLSVEADHDYFVGDLSSLTHNQYNNGNRKDSTRTAYLYKLSLDTGEFLKWGITQNEKVAQRYTRKFMKDKKIEQVESGTREAMLRRERELVEQSGGPLNREPWSASRRLKK